MKRRVSISLDEELVEQYDRKAEEQGISRSKLMAHILEVGASDSDDAQSLLIDIEQKIAEFRKAQTEE